MSMTDWLDWWMDLWAPLVTWLVDYGMCWLTSLLPDCPVVEG